MSNDFISLRIEIGHGIYGQFDFDLDEITLGRNPDCDVILKASGISRHHATIVRRDDTYYLKDNDSRNGTFLNGERITDEQILRDGDKIRILEADIDVSICPISESAGVEETTIINFKAKQ
ncbi:MAG: hypothetical protein A2284_11840 [Deltaproteobacteria bacterium RIFOXYA12_FULL_61_11]|nr:MAG: hypothetical protein A2284_11840 [Deltaproteobacteria bacterium RIFOXYA12_FULL_61_11]